MKPAVSKELRTRILDLRRQHSLREVAELTGVPIGTVKTLCSRSGAFRDNEKHRALFSLPPVSESTTTEITVPQLPPQAVVTGDVEIDAVLWLQQVVSTGQPDLIAKAMEAKKRIRTPMNILENRYRDFLIRENPGNVFAVAFGTIGFGDLEDKAGTAVSTKAMSREALARFGNETAVFNNTPAEDFLIQALVGVEYEGKHGLPELTQGAIAAFQLHTEYCPHTLSDCLHELIYWTNLYKLRNSVSRDYSDGLYEEQVRRDFLFWLMARIRPRHKHEAMAVMKYMLDEDNDLKDRDEFDGILLNMLETR